MAAVRVVLPAAEASQSNRRSMALVTPFDRVDVPYAPRETTHGGFARQTEVIPRPMLRDLVRLGGPGLQTLSFTLIVAHLDPYRSIEDTLAGLKRIAEGGDPVSVRYGPLERSHLWRLTEMSINGVLRRPDRPARPDINLPGTFGRRRGSRRPVLDLGDPQDITRATVSMTFTQVSDALLRITPITKAAPKGKPAPKPAPKPSTAPSAPKPPAPPVTTTYTVRRGDTLSGIAARLLGNSDRYREIATLNGIRNPNRIFAGQRLRLPKR